MSGPAVRGRLCTGSSLAGPGEGCPTAFTAIQWFSLLLDVILLRLQEVVDVAYLVSVKLLSRLRPHPMALWAPQSILKGGDRIRFGTSARFLDA